MNGNFAEIITKRYLYFTEKKLSKDFKKSARKVLTDYHRDKLQLKEKKGAITEMNSYLNSITSLFLKNRERRINGDNSRKNTI